MKTPSLLVLLASLLPLGPGAVLTYAEKPAPDITVPAPGQAKVQLAILLDTSGSMSGLIEQAKTQLWAIVNTFIDARQNGKVPFVEVALYEYGKSSLEAETHWVRQIQPLSRDLDKISEELFKLTTNGGEEYCGAVIQRAAADLAWDPSPDVYKAIFVCGNEPFNQGPVNPDDSCKESIAKGIIVNTIHCGGEAEGVSTGWKNGAALADGRFLNIDHNAAVVHIDAPQDAKIAELSASLNGTYLAYGSEGAAKAESQVAQDANASEKAGSGAALQRAISKSSLNYYNGNWDLVDAAKEKSFDITKVKDEDLPEELRGKSTEEKTALIQAKAESRAKIQQEIQDLNKERESFVAEKRKELLKDSEAETLDKAVISTVRSQAEKKGYTFE